MDICAPITQAEAEAVLGQFVTSITPEVNQDSISGGTLYYCNYLGTGRTVVISLVDMGSAQTARQEMEEQLVKMPDDDASTTSAQVRVTHVELLFFRSIITRAGSFWFHFLLLCERSISFQSLESITCSRCPSGGTSCFGEPLDRGALIIYTSIHPMFL